MTSFQKCSYAALEEIKKQRATAIEKQQTQETLQQQKMDVKRQKETQVTPNEEEPSKVLKTQEADAARELYPQQKQAQILIAFSEFKQEIKKLRIENLRTQLADKMEKDFISK